MIKMAIDVMGMDKGSEVAVKAINRFLNEYKDVELTVFGNNDELSLLNKQCNVVDCKEVMGMEDGALAILRKKETSMIKAVEYVKEHDLDGVVSGGSTGAFLTASTIHLKLIECVERAALVSPFPTIKDKNVIVLDIGANSENTPAHLLQFAKMGRIFSKAYNDLENPSIYLLSNGAEEKKGSQLVKEAHQLIKNSAIEGFKGNIEARYALSGEADVIVAGGFDGNILLKSCEGTAKEMANMLKAGFKKNIFTKIGYLFAKSGVDDVKRKMDYKQYGGAMLLGVNKVVVKAHGSSDEIAFFSALKVCYNLIKKDIINKMKEEMK